MSSPKPTSEQLCWCGHTRRQHHWAGACIECALNAWHKREVPMNANHPFVAESSLGEGAIHHQDYQGQD